MHRSTSSLVRNLGLIVCAATLMTSSASALEISVIGPSEITVAPGELFTIDLAISNESETTTRGFIVDLHGLTAANATPIAGRAARNYFVHSCLPSICIGGTRYTEGPYSDPDDLLVNYIEGDGRVDPNTIDLIETILQSVPFETSYSGALDPGLDGPLDEPSPRDVTLDLMTTAIGTHVFSIRGIHIGLEPWPHPPVAFEQDASFTVHVIPEPSSTMLILLGLIGLSTTTPRHNGGRRPPAARKARRPQPPRRALGRLECGGFVARGTNDDEGVLAYAEEEEVSR